MGNKESELSQAAGRVAGIFGLQLEAADWQELERVLRRAARDADFIYRYPELGTAEIKAATVVSKGLETVLGKEKVRVLVKENVGEVRTQAGGIKERDFSPRWWSAAEFWQARHHLSEKEVGGVLGILEGDKPDGPVVIIAEDLDALVGGHHCGHNIHASSLFLNACLLAGMQKKGVKIPARRIAFLGRVNEEGIQKQFSEVLELEKAGLWELMGEPDVLLASHILPSVPEGEVVLESGAATASVGFFSIQLKAEKENRVPLEVTASRIIQDINRRWQSDEAGRAEPRLNFPGEDPYRQIVRVVDSEISERKSALDSSVLKEEVLGELPLLSSWEETGRKVKEGLERLMADWRPLGVKAVVELEKEKLKIGLKGPGGHAAAAGVNLEYLLSQVILTLYEGGVRWQGKESLRMVGTVRLKVSDWQEKGERVMTHLKNIAAGEGQKVRAQSQFEGRVVVPPVVNHPGLRKRAERLLTENHLLVVAEKRFSAAYGEPLGFWGQRFPKLKTLLVWVGTGDREKLKRAAEEGLPLEPMMQLHHQQMKPDSRNISYFGLLTVLALAGLES